MSDSAVGYGACLIAIFCFGSNYVPAKKVEVGDGVFFQFMMCNAVNKFPFPASFKLIQSLSDIHDITPGAGCSGFSSFPFICYAWRCVVVHWQHDVRSHHSGMHHGLIFSKCFLTYLKLIGMGMGLLIWGSFNMLMGWASGTFGKMQMQRYCLS
jgi:hypothetical protein